MSSAPAPPSSAPAALRKRSLGRGPNNIPKAPTNPNERILIHIRPPPENTDFVDRKIVKCISQLCLDGWPTPVITWVETPSAHKDKAWEEFQKIYRWDPAHHATIQILFWQKCAVRTKDNLSKERNKALNNASIDYEGQGEEFMKEYNPWWCTKPIWEKMCEKWGEEGWVKRRKTAATNRASGVPTGGHAKCTYRGGSKSQLQHIASQEADSQGQPIHWPDVYVATRDGLPEAVHIADTYNRLMDERYSEGSPRPSIDQELWERASVAKKNYVKGQRLRCRPSISGTGSCTGSSATQSSQPSCSTTTHTPADCVRAICQDRNLLRTLGDRLRSLRAEELAAAVATAAKNQDPGIEPRLDDIGDA